MTILKESSVTVPEKSTEPARSSDAARGRTMVWVGVAVLVAGALYLLQLAILLPALAISLLIRSLPARVAAGNRAFLAVPLLLALVVAMTLVLQLVGLGLHPLWTFLPIVAVAAAACARRARPIEPVEMRLQFAAIVPWIVGLLVASFLGSTFVLTRDGAPRGLEQRISILATAEDPASHLAVFDTVLFAGGIPVTKAARVHSDQWSYPPLFHIATAVMLRSLDHTIGTTPLRGGRVDALILASISAFALLVAAMCSIAIQLGVRLGGAVTPLAVAAGGIGILMLSWVPFSLYQHGFYPQILSLGLTMILMLAALVDDRSGYRLSVVVVATCVTMIAWSWYFVVPVAGLIAVGWLATQFRTAWHSLSYTAGVVLAAMLASAIPIYVSLSLIDRAVLNTGGGVAPLTFAYAAAPAVIAFGLLMAGPEGQEFTRVRRVSMLALVAAFIFAFGMRTYQMHTAGQTSYFFTKSLFTLLLFGIAMAPAAIGARLSSRSSARWRAASAMVLVLVAAFLVTDARPTDRRLSGMWTYRDGLSASGLSPLFARYLAEPDRLGDRHIFVWDVSDQPVEDYTASRWLNALNDRSDAATFSFYRETVFEQDDAALARFIDSTCGRVALITHRRGLVSDLIVAGADPVCARKVEVVDV